MYCILDNMAFPNIDILLKRVNIGCCRKPAEIADIQPFIVDYLFVQILYEQCTIKKTNEKNKKIKKIKITKYYFSHFLSV